MSNVALRTEQEAQTLQNQELSLEAQVFLAFKRKSKNRHELLDQLTRANVILEKQLTNKTRLLHPKARIIAEKILNKLAHTGVEKALLTHKQLQTITRCLELSEHGVIFTLNKNIGDEFSYNPIFIYADLITNYSNVFSKKIEDNYIFCILK